MDTGRRATSSDVIVYLDADVTNTSPEFVPRLLQPLFERPDVVLVDVEQGFVDKGMEAIRASLHRAAERKRITSAT